MSFLRQQLEATSDLYQHKFEYTNTSYVLYKGDAAPGIATSYAGWRIAKFTYDVNWNVTDIQWAAGTSEFNQIWNNRGSLTYS